MIFTFPPPRLVSSGRFNSDAGSSRVLSSAARAHRAGDKAVDVTVGQVSVGIVMFGATADVHAAGHAQQDRAGYAAACERFVGVLGRGHTVIMQP